MDPVRNIKIKSDLLLGVEHDEIRKRYDLSKKELQIYVTELHQEKTIDEPIQELVHTDKDALQLIAEEVKENVPFMAKDIENVVNGVIGLQLLDAKFRDTVSNILDKTNNLLDDPLLSVNDLKSIGTTISTMYGQVFNKNVTNVNVLNNTNNNIGINDEKRDIFKAKLRS